MINSLLMAPIKMFIISLALTLNFSLLSCDQFYQDKPVLRMMKAFSDKKMEQNLIELTMLSSTDEILDISKLSIKEQLGFLHNIAGHTQGKLRRGIIYLGSPQLTKRVRESFNNLSQNILFIEEYRKILKLYEHEIIEYRNVNIEWPYLKPANKIEGISSFYVVVEKTNDPIIYKNIKINMPQLDLTKELSLYLDQITDVVFSNGSKATLSPVKVDGWESETTQLYEVMFFLKN